MIIKVKKILIYGIKDQIDQFFNKSQKKGFLEFISSKKAPKQISQTIKDYILAIKILKKQPVFSEVKEEEEVKSSEALAHTILHLNASVEQLYEEKRLINAEIIRVQPFGDFSKEDLDKLQTDGNRIFQFFCLKSAKREKMKLSDEMIFIGSQYDLDYFVTINKEKKVYPNMIEIFIDRPLSILQDRLSIIDTEIDKFHQELKEYTFYIKFLKKELIKKLNVFNLKKAKGEVSFPLKESLFAIEAWVPENKTNDLNELCNLFCIDYETIAIEKKDRVPTYMENKGYDKVGEDLVNIYDVPAIEDKDPSLWVLISFALFFAIIVSDAGYGLVYFLIALLMKFKFKNPKPLLKRFIKLTMLLSSCCMIWGALIGSFFGMSISLNDPLSKVSAMNYIIEKKAAYHLKQKDDVYDYWIKKYPKAANAKDGKDFLLKVVKTNNNKQQYEATDAFQSNILMEIAIFIGVIHIALSFLRCLFKNFAGLGWVIFMIGGYLYFPSILGATSFIHFLNILDKNICFMIGKYLLLSGMILSVVLAFVQKKLKGALEITNIIQVFADVLSYLRLYALGLAGMIMATTFNDLGAAMGLGIGFIVIIIGHLVNILLAVMGGVIHGLRLNFIEWYHYSFEGDGKLFNPLRLFK